MTHTHAQFELADQAVQLVQDLLETQRINDENFPCYAPVFRKLIADYKAAVAVVHIRAPDSRWPRDNIPGCDNDGDGPNDSYTNDHTRVTCVDCLAVLAEECE